MSEIIARADILSNSLENVRWTDVTTTIEKTPLEQQSMQEVGLYNGILLTLDSIASRLPNHPFVQKFRVYAGSQFLKEPKHIESSSEYDDKASNFEFWKQHKDSYFGDVFAPDSVRARRRLCMEELQALPKDDKKKWDNESDAIIRKVAYLDAIGYQLVTNQHKISVSSHESEKVSSLVTIIRSPVESTEGEIPSSEKPLAVALTGYGNDTRGGAPLIAEIALNGQDVAHISYPDSYHEAEMSDKFVELAEQSEGLTAHAEYFKACVRKIIEDNPGRRIELWGQSTGCLVWATALSDPEFSKLIDGAILIHPAGTADVANQKLEFVKEGGNVASSLARAGLYSWVIGSRDTNSSSLANMARYPTMLAQSVAENVLGVGKRGRIWKKIMTETKRSHSVYNEMNLKDGKKILRINAKGDTTTMSSTRPQGNNEISKYYDGTHADTNLRPDIVVPLAMKWKQDLYGI